MTIAEMLAQEARRQQALKGGMAARNPKTYVGPRPDAESSLDRPTLYWPDERHLVPDRCHHCGSGQAGFETDPPYGLRKSGSITCLTCSRIVANLRDAGTRRIGRVS